MIWEVIGNFFKNLYENANGWMHDTLKTDEIVVDFYNNTIAPMPELIKIVGAVFIGIIVILGCISFIKKFLKTFVAIAVILVIVWVIVYFL